MSTTPYPALAQVVFDSTDVRRLAEFYRRLLGYEYRAGDEPPGEGNDDVRGRDWLVLLDPASPRGLAFQQVAELPTSTWPDPAVPQQLHLDLTVGSKEDLDAQHSRVVALGARVLLDRSDDETEPLRVYADPDGHPFCIFVAPR